MAVGGVGGLISQAAQSRPRRPDSDAYDAQPQSVGAARRRLAGSEGGRRARQRGAAAAAAAWGEPGPRRVHPARSGQQLLHQGLVCVAAARRQRRDLQRRHGPDGGVVRHRGSSKQSKQAALRHGGGAVGDSLGDLAKMQGMQDQTIADNEHARFQANAAIFAQTLSQSLGRPVSVQEAMEIQNSPDLMKQISATVGANATTTGTQKDADAATRAWADAHPEATPKDIADYKANLIAGGMGGNDLETAPVLG